MILDMDTMTVEEVEAFVAEVAEKDGEEEVYELEEDMAKEVTEGAEAHMKTELIYQMSPVTLKIQIGTNSQTIQGRQSPRTRCLQSYW